jgi:nitroimidazol reductase NimA-like FMN-containing flavoprotein (pyridoxamine 5'-phosphate oxidase superfamily)
VKEVDLDHLLRRLGERDWMAKVSQLKIEELSDEEAKGLLARNQLGRIAYTFRAQVDIRPLMYAYEEGWLFGRTSSGEKLRILRHNRWVALVVDEVVDFWNWESVVVRGGIHFFGQRGDAEDTAMRERALLAIRGVIPEALTEADPAAERNFLYGLAVHEISGRKAKLMPAR